MKDRTQMTWGGHIEEQGKVTWGGDNEEQGTGSAVEDPRKRFLSYSFQRSGPPND